MITTLFFLAIMLVGAPIGMCLCLSGLVYIFSTGDTVLLQSFPLQMFGGVDSYGLIAIPLFILIGEIMNSGGITRQLVAMSMAFIGSFRADSLWNRAGLMLAASIIGSATAQVAIMCQIMVPAMEKEGYDKTFAAGLTVYGGMLGPIIPPSVMFVIYSVLAQVAVGDMLIAGILPGILLTALFFGVIAVLGVIHNYPRSPKRTLAQRARTVVVSSPTLLIPIIIAGSILAGIANPTEAAAVGAVASVLIGRYVTREFKFSSIPAIMLRTGLYSSIVLFLVAAAAVFSWVLIYGKMPQMVAAWIQTVATDPVSFLLLTNLILLGSAP